MALLSTSAMAVLTLVSSAADPELLWSNGIDGEANGHAISPPVFPVIRQADDFVIEDGSWLVTDIVYQTIEDAGWERGETIQTFAYADSGGDTPGVRTHLLETDFLVEFQDYQLFGRDVYHYWLHDLAFGFDAGRHWLGPRNPDGGGAGTNYWIECREDVGDCGPDAPGTFPNASSLDGGDTWQSHGSPYHFQFQLHGFRALGAPFAFDITRGRPAGGDLASLEADDDDRLRVAATRPSKVSQASVEVIVEGFSPVDFSLATAIGFTLDAHATAAAIERIDLYNWVQGRYVRLHEAEASIGADRTTDVIIRDDVSEFITPAASRMRARVSYYDPGLSIAGWFGAIDRAGWRVGRPSP